jgi:hypothetical protein
MVSKSQGYLLHSSIWLTDDQGPDRPGSGCPQEIDVVEQVRKTDFLPSQFPCEKRPLPRQARDKQKESPTAEGVWCVWWNKEPPFEGNISYAVAHVDAFEGGKHRGGAKCKGGWLGSKYPMIGAETAALRPFLKKNDHHLPRQARDTQRKVRKSKCMGVSTGAHGDWTSDWTVFQLDWTDTWITMSVNGARICFPIGKISAAGFACLFLMRNDSIICQDRLGTSIRESWQQGALAFRRQAVRKL